MKAYLASLALVSTLAAGEPAEPSGCNATQERIVARVEALRQYDEGNLTHRCFEGDMRFYDNNPMYQDYENPFGFVTGKDGVTYFCRIENGEILCRFPLNEEEAIESIRKLYSRNKLEA